jgi:O-antigen ligase
MGNIGMQWILAVNAKIVTYWRPLALQSAHFQVEALIMEDVHRFLGRFVQSIEPQTALKTKACSRHANDTDVVRNVSRKNRCNYPNAMIYKNKNAWCNVVGLGLLWLMVGMVVMPAGAALNPSKSYQGILIVLLYLPAFGLALAGRAALWRVLLCAGMFRVFLMLLCWAAITLFWSPVHHPGEELARLTSVLTFVLAWQVWTRANDQRARQLLWLGGVGIALAAAGYLVLYLLQPPTDGRIVGDGVIATANYAAAVMGVSLLWLYQMTDASRTRTLVRVCGMGALLVFIALTETRSVWLALALCLVAAPIWDRRRRAWLMAGAVVLLTLFAGVFFCSLLLERGASLRPQLFLESLILICRHPWLGLGQGASFILTIAGTSYTHSHNVLTQTAIELGLPGILLAAMLWLMVGWEGWRHRHTAQGLLLCSIWLYATVVLQFDMPQLLDSPRPSWLLFWIPFAVALQMATRDALAVSGAEAPSGRGQPTPLHCSERV